MSRRPLGSGSVYEERGRWIAQISIGQRGVRRFIRRTVRTREEAEAILAQVQPVTVEDRFWLKVEKTETCWLWTGGTDYNGYGKIRVGSQDVQAHRFSYALHYGIEPADLYVCHHCDVKPCVRPDHLFLGTQADNMADYHAKLRSQRVTP